MAEPGAWPTPFIVVGGFLRAGKTTLLNHWLGQAHGLRLAVLVNDFGAVNLDATLVARRGTNTVALTNGCVCCSLGDDLGAALPRLLATEPPFDALVVEASGVADPWRIAQYALAEPRLALAGVLVLLDAGAVLEQAADPLLASSLATPLAHADLVLLNKAERADAPRLAAVRAWVAQHAGAVPVLATTQARLPLAPWLGPWLAPESEPGLEAGLRPAPGWPPAAERGLRGAAAPEGAGAGPFSRLIAGGPASPLAVATHAQHFEHWTHTAAAGQYIDPAALRAWLRNLPPGVLRLKGLLPGHDGRWCLLQFAGRHASVRRLATAPHGAVPAVVAIGLAGQLPVAALAAGLAAALRA